MISWLRFDKQWSQWKPVYFLNSLKQQPFIQSVTKRLLMLFNIKSGKEKGFKQFQELITAKFDKKSLQSTKGITRWNRIDCRVWQGYKV